MFIDISVKLSDRIPAWPGSSGVSITRVRSIERGDATTDSYLSCDVHSGTHLDAPAHIFADGATVDALSLESLIGPATVVEHDALGHITATTLERMVIGSDTKRLLFKTQNSSLWNRKEFAKDFIGLTADAAEWIVRRKIEVVGIDYLSIEPFGQNLGTHSILLRSGVIILEGLNMSSVTSGQYEMICLPIRLAGAEGAPARAVLKPVTMTLKDVP
ncbi:Metal-dependent hydrolase [Trichlorobacter ammonificans]|uniref:Metal-dependent hydrolase n=2 Tax=Trichlorobacter ammonificans TaxID=2916410 RepID=A0ABN8HGF7_9BACT|nr:Metal-dependent hydrolase [Trichlorobacter ammonificans]